MASKFCKVFYDIKSQMSYWDNNFRFPVISNKDSGSTCETCTIENSDIDEFSLLPPGTRTTRTIEDSDADEFRQQTPTTKKHLRLKTVILMNSHCVNNINLGA